MPWTTLHPGVRNSAALLLLPRGMQNHQQLKYEMSGRSNILWDNIQQLQGENLSTPSTFLIFFSRPCEGEPLNRREMEGRQGLQGHRLCGKCGGFYLKLRLHKRHCLPPRWHQPTSFHWPPHPPPSSWPAHPPLSTWRQRSQTCVSWLSNQAPTSCAVCQLRIWSGSRYSISRLKTDIISNDFVAHDQSWALTVVRTPNEYFW